ncbi:hypothetical protein GCM10010987_36610 [Bradyrhizobium guangdongense]|nr:hypothetical protein GCM10010987_36610 [Bradyrhizobium guangdongense]
MVEFEKDQFTLHLVTDPKNAKAPDHALAVLEGAVASPIPPAWKLALTGSQLELVLHPARFLFRPLDLPRRAAEYAAGVVRSQIDRLTPWDVQEAVYGWSASPDETGDRIQLTIAATPRAKLTPLLDAIGSLGTWSILVSTSRSNVPIRIVETQIHGPTDFRRVRTCLMVVLLLSGFAATSSLCISALISDGLALRREELSRKISVLTRASQNVVAESALRELEQQKRNTPSPVMAIEALSDLLPDNTFLTELRIDHAKLQIAGLTSDAASLIRLIEQSPQFSHAIFFAPTTRSEGATKEQFHVEAQINPAFAAIHEPDLPH